MSNVVAGVVRGQFPYLDEHIAQKKANLRKIQRGIKGFASIHEPNGSGKFRTKLLAFLLDC